MIDGAFTSNFINRFPEAQPNPSRPVKSFREALSPTLLPTPHNTRQLLQNCIQSDTITSMYTVLRSHEFDKWLVRLKDVKGRARIVARIRSAELGNLGDVKPVGDGISEMRIHFGPGYRVYFIQRGRLLIFLLIGGDKSSQNRDIAKAKALAETLEE